MPSQACAADELGRRHREDLVGGPGDDVGDQHLLAEPDDESAHAVGEVVDRHHAPRQLIGDVAVADDRAGDQLREQQQVERGVHRALLRGRVAPRDVDDVRDRVEGEERDADRQQHARHGERLDVRQQQQRVDVVGEEVRVLEDAEDDEVDRDGEREPARRGRRAVGAVDRDRHPVVERDRAEHQPGERAAALRVEDDARRQQQPVAVRRMLARAAEEIEPEEDRQEEEEKCGFGEQQGGWALGTGR